MSYWTSFDNAPYYDSDYGPDYYSYRRGHAKHIVWSRQPVFDSKPNTDTSHDLLRVQLELNHTFRFLSKPPLKYIDVSSQSAGLAAIYQSNLITSRLLCLPAELRLRIWKLVLGGHQIRLTNTGGHYLALYKFYTYHGRFYKISRSPCKVHKGDIEVENVAALFTILFTCRQIYHEARTVPFSCNTWELWTRLDRHDRRLCWIHWLDLYDVVDDGARNVITWVLAGDSLKSVQLTKDAHEIWWAMSLEKGSKFAVKSDGSGKADWDVVRRFADTKGTGTNQAKLFGLQFLTLS